MPRLAWPPAPGVDVDLLWLFPHPLAPVDLSGSRGPRSVVSRDLIDGRAKPSSVCHTSPQRPPNFTALYLTQVARRVGPKGVISWLCFLFKVSLLPFRLHSWLLGFSNAAVIDAAMVDAGLSNKLARLGSRPPRFAPAGLFGMHSEVGIAMRTS